ncbi:5-hydroxyisourate hydrolase [Pseudomonas reinekei]|uniref:Hydroxyisourate hydrolase n=1 Tax=Pseudomonas reinekei TaxID=395598 RepID=A0A1H0U0G0_PSERE|nr:hydroxyisourate hydrolase [Pseudomonas reinekei]SDP59306.1 5-hydroxyisourate hydrolase [Pseudomonas reinekei]
MKVMKLFFAGAVLSALSSLASAAANPLSVHVLNLQDGLPSPAVKVTLEKKNGQNWDMLNTASTNDQGRIPEFYPDGKSLEKGIYRVTFKTGEWFTVSSPEIGLHLFHPNARCTASGVLYFKERCGRSWL